MKNKTFLILFFLSLYSQIASTRDHVIYRLSLSNGLSSNSVYTTITDHLGYLWIATPNGVLRYNGYSFIRFTTSDGMPTNDVWQLKEDKRGRIWLGTITDRIGYIYKEKYYSAKLSDSTNHTIYPHNMNTTDSGIMFFSNYILNSLNPALCVEQNDTIKTISLIPGVQKLLPFLDGLEKKCNILPLCNEVGDGALFCKEYLLRFRLNGSKVQFNSEVKKISDKTFLEDVRSATVKYTSNYIIFFNQNVKRNYFYVLDIRDTIPQKIPIDRECPEENILNIDQYNTNTIYIITNNHVLLYDFSDGFRITSKILIKELSLFEKLSGTNLLSICSHDQWGDIICTSGAGMDINFRLNPFFRNTGTMLEGYKYEGSTSKGSSLWWNYNLSKLCLRSADGRVTEMQIEVKKIVKSNFRNNSLHLGNGYLFYDKELEKCYALKDDRYTVTNYFQVDDSPKICYGICNFGMFRSNPDDGVDSIKYIDKERYTGFEWDKRRNIYWAYNKDKILRYDKKTTYLYKKGDLSKLGINKVEKLVVDSVWGNIFVKSGENLILYNFEENSAKPISTGFNLNESSICIRKDMLIVYGPFGLVFYKIAGLNSLGKAIYYPNFKSILFNNVSDVHCYADSIYINTDAGLMSCPIPDDGIAHEELLKKGKYIFNNGGEANIITNGDTILLSQDNLSLQFDVINPYGTGSLAMWIQSGGSIYDLRSNIFNVSNKKLTPGTYYTVSLWATDDIVKMTPVVLHLYITPYWWQTKTMKIVIVSTVILAIAAIITISILITRKLVLRAAKKRQLRMEMELKSIYAQINPHFIFNSLNSALLLVSKNQMNEAYDHISKFSRLLRSYIRSSRNKYILLSDEIKNLTNYIDLQQTRFKNKFDYKITVEPDIDTSFTKIPSLLLQPFVENAIEHGLLNKTEKGTLKIEFKTNDEKKKLYCIIDDDGIGRTESKQNKVPNPIKDESYGELLIKDLVSIFNKYEHMNIKVSYMDKAAPETGTTVTIEIATV